MDRNFVTLIQAPGDINKQVSLIDGKPTKKPAGLISEGIATTIPAFSLQEFADIVTSLSGKSDTTLVLGFVPGTEDGEPYTILSTGLMAQRLGVSKADCPSGLQTIDGRLHATRTRANFEFSNWMMLDYDRVKGMPDSLETADPNTWLDWMGKLVPGFTDAGHIIVSSTTGRVMLDGNSAFSSGGWHAYVHVNDGQDIQRFGKELLIYSMGTPYGFMRPIFKKGTDEVKAHRPWAIFDPTTFSPERLVFEGKPVVKHPRLSVANVELNIKQGKALDTRLLEVTEDERSLVEKKTGYKVEQVRQENTYIHVLRNETDLKLDTMVDTEKGPMTIADYWISDHQKLRAQAPFRPDSTSQAAYLNRHKDNTPFLFDVGIQTKFTLEKNDAQRFALQQALNWIDEQEPEVVAEHWLEHIRGLNAQQQDKVRRAVHSKTGVGLQVLAKELGEANKEIARQDRALQLKKAKDIKAMSDRVPVEWMGDQLDVVVRTVKRRLQEHSQPGLVFNYGGVLTCVTMGKPMSVRQIQKRYELGDEYPEQFRVFAYTRVTCEMRILESVSFYTGDECKICPPRVAQALLDDPVFATPLAGLLEVPSVTPTGRVLKATGYDAESGYYCTFDRKLANTIPETASKADALEAVEYIKSKMFEGFPFAADLDSSCAIAFLLTAFVRRFLDRAPGFMVTATTQASGKSALVEIVFQAAFGRPAAASSWSDSQEEMQKHILAILMEGHSGVCFDNLPYGCRVDGDELAKLITQEVYSARILGMNKSAQMPTNILVALTGNQLAAVNDMPSRLLPINLCPDVENPENTRYARRDITEWITTHRQEIVVAVCSIYLAWHAADEDVEIGPSRFSSWDDAVRKPMTWLGLPDVNQAFDSNRAEDPARETRGNFVKAWYDLHGDQWVDLSDIKDSWNEFAVVDPKEEAMREAIMDLLPDGRPDARHLGLNLRFFKGVVFDGLRLEQQLKTSGSKKSRPWRVAPVNSSGGVKGVKGVCTSPAQTEGTVICTDSTPKQHTPQCVAVGKHPPKPLNPPEKAQKKRRLAS